MITLKVYCKISINININLKQLSMDQGRILHKVAGLSVFNVNETFKEVWNSTFKSGRIG